MNRENLTTLANYLLALPTDYQHFGMSHFSELGHGPRDYYLSPSCGTVGCAAGHGPAAGLKPTVNDVDWWVYIERVFGLPDGTQEWDWCFSAHWGEFDIDNTPHGAGRRILHMLEHGVPVGFWDADPTEWSDFVQVYMS